MTLSIFTIVLLIAFVLTVNYFNGVVNNLRGQLLDLGIAHEVEKKKVHKDSKFRSTNVTWGKSIENFVPFMDTFPIPPEDVVFLGMPIDFIGFTETDDNVKCEVHLIEIKSGQAGLSKKQLNIKKAVKEGRVKWHEVRVAGAPK